MAKKILAVFEIFAGLILTICFFLNGKIDTPIKSVIGFDLNVISGVIIIGVFYIVKAITILVLEMAEPTSASFSKKLLTFFEIIVGFSLITAGLCDGRDTIIEKYFNLDIVANHGVVILGVYYASRAVVQLFFEDDGKGLSI